MLMRAPSVFDQARAGVIAKVALGERTKTHQLHIVARTERGSRGVWGKPGNRAAQDAHALVLRTYQKRHPVASTL
jgi:hypothetical protein